MGLFSQEQIDQINAVAAKSKEILKPVQGAKSITSVQQELEDSTRKVLEYFGDSPAILITSVEQLHDYVTKAISAGYCGIDTETTGLDRIHDTVVGCSLYYPGGVECYIPNKHRIPIFETYYKNQLSYEDVGRELQRFVDAGIKMIFANADFDLAMIYKDYKVNLIHVFYYDVITAWRCLKEDEPDNRLKTLVWKYLHGMKGDPKSFSDFFSPKLFPYCRPEVAKLYAANDAKITFELFKWQLPYVTKSHPKCQKHHLEKIADLVWNVEFPMVGVCAMMHRIGVYYDMGVRNILKQRYDSQYQIENAKLSDMVQEIIDKSDIVTIQRSPFKLGRDFNEGSPKHVTYLLNSFMNCQVASGDKATLKLLNLPVTDQILKVRALGKLLNSFIDKLPDMVGPDGRIHSTFKSIGADTGRMCIAKGENIICSTSSTGTKHIEDIVPGDVVYCFNSDGELEEKPVKNLWLTGRDKECVGINWVDADDSTNAGLLICTPEHPILTISGEWISAQQLNPGDELVHWVSHISPKVTSIVSMGTYDVYDIEVEDNHNFFAEGICVHNSSSDPNVQQIPSHATDIRHQFRATPAMEKIDVCEQVDGTLQITLGSYDSVTINGGEQKDVVDLCVGDEIISVKGILKIREVNHQLPYTTLVFDSSQVEDHIKHITPPYVMMSSDYSQQEPKMLAYKSGDPKMIDAFQHNRDIYATIAGLSFNKPYEDCLEFYVDENGKKTDQVNKEGKERRTQAKSIVLGITYGRSTKTVGEQLFGKNKDMTEDEKTKAAQGVYDAVLNSFPNLDSFMHKCQADARKYGYVETILGRRRHIRDMQLKPYEFKAGRGYVNPDIDPLDPNTLKNKNEIPERVVKQLEKEFAKYKYKGQIYKRIKELEEIDHIRVVSNTKKITDATRQCVNSVIQGSAAELTKIAQLKVANNQEWHELGARILLPVHDELIAEVPIRNAKRAGELLGQLMSDAGSFLPFTISCDVTTTLRWYGLEYPCTYQKPSSSDFEHLSAPELQWIQYHLFECEYILPVFNDPDGKKPMGDAALGVNGIWSEDTQNAITDYCNRYHISKEEFIDHIESKVVYDLQKLK